MSDRKPVQFQYVYGCGFGNGYIVLADDGTFWRWWEHNPDRGWIQLGLTPLPQPAETNDGRPESLPARTP